MSGHIVAVVNRKGGVGKTTVAVGLAAALASPSRPVLLIDADVQGAASVWASPSWPFEVLHLPTPFLTSRAIRMAEAGHLVVIDGPAVDEKVTRAAIDVADLVLVPVMVSGLDLRATHAVVDMIRAAGKPGAWVVNRTQRVRVAHGAMEALEAMGLPVLGALSHRVAQVEATLSGLPVTLYAPGSPAAVEVEVLARAVLALLKGGNHDEATHHRGQQSRRGRLGRT